MPNKAKKRITPAAKHALIWFINNGPMGLFGRGDPTLQMVRRLAKDGLIEALPTQMMQFVKYQITQKGRDALK